jgi:hypothetical protein
MILKEKRHPPDDPHHLIHRLALIHPVHIKLPAAIHPAVVIIPLSGTFLHGRVNGF